MTTQTRRRKFIAAARKKAYRDGQREREDQFYVWFRKAVKKAKKGDWSSLEKGPVFCTNLTIQCAADISALFTRAQHNLDAGFEDLLGEFPPAGGPAFAQAVISKGNEKIQKS